MAQNCVMVSLDELLAGFAETPPPPREAKIPPVKVILPKQPGGYDCEFVEKPPSAIQTECSICLQILSVPKIIDCCGHSFCGVCIDRIAKGGKCCPLCKERDYTLIRNKGLERALNEFDVKCSYFKEGCCWTGKLGDFAFHLQSECGFVEEICRHGCGVYFERRFLQQHQDVECPKRLFSCDYCRAFSSTFEDVTFNHYSVCGSYPVPCPNKCDFPYAIERRDLPNHVDNDCPLTEVSCDFSFAGCKVKLPRKDMPDHLKENVTHLSLMASKLMEKDKQIATLNSEVLQRQDNFEKQLFSLKEENERLTDRLQHQEKLTASMDAHREEVDRNSKQVASLCSHSGLPPCRLVMINFSKKCSNQWFSEPFYTHPKGYKMCLQVVTSFESRGRIARAHISVFINLMQGEFDHHLIWPFRGSVTIQLKDWKGRGTGWTKDVPFSDITPDYTVGRLTDRVNKLVTRDQIQPRCLLNDQLCFVISKVDVACMPV